MIFKRTGLKPDTVLVTFQIPNSIWAETIHLVGDFNNWDRKAFPLTPSNRDSGAWEITLELGKGRVYQFRYLIDGINWLNDWTADGFVLSVYGGEFSVLEI